MRWPTTVQEYGRYADELLRTLGEDNVRWLRDMCEKAGLDPLDWMPHRSLETR